MPAYVQHHATDTAPMICPSCMGLFPMFVREVEPHWSAARINLVYECAGCGEEIRQTVEKSEARH